MTSAAVLALEQRSRTVRRARLRPARDEDAATLRHAVEDALNTADFCDLGRLIVVRRLRLRGLPPRPTPGQVARALEAAWRELAPRALPMAHPGAADAEAVWVASRFEARLLWLENFAPGRAADAWFWPRALPELRSLGAASIACSEEAVEAVVSCALAEASAEVVHRLRSWSPAAVARLVGVDTPAVRQMAAALAQGAARPGDAGGNTPRSGQADSARGLLSAPLAPTPPAAVDARDTNLSIAPLRAPVASSGSDRERMDLSAMPGTPAPSSSPWPEPRPRHRPAGRAEGQSRDSRPAESAPVADARGERHRDRVEASDAAHASSESAPADAPQRKRTAFDGGRPHSPIRVSPRPGPAAFAALPWLAEGLASENGGLLFLVNVLRALGFDRWIERFESRLQRALAVRLLGELLDRCGAGKEEPLRACLDFDDDDLRLLAQARFGGAGDAPRALRLWRARLRRFLRSRIGIELRDVVARPAWVFVTATHVDIAFPLEAADLRLRRFGLDSDPGWQPWFGRIVAFHFLPPDIWPGGVPEEGSHG